MKTVQTLIEEIERASTHKYIKNVSIYSTYITFTIDAPLKTINKLFDYLKSNFPSFKITNQIFYHDKLRDYDARFYIDFEQSI